ncbi:MULTISPECIES: DUF305 domain-containing protein [Mucilaginibacter]|jgi:uncharacterized protein (DUF305 family)|uniref:DUF305 domain-containing protein n=2 Tax=Mucilaginibacter TaxID=423349 RepID=A0A6I4INY4_9SPHI|nr:MULTISPECIES: DUF305 domain-containing protein [Mucilaginibacter]MBB5395020.1 uncharacterized protein (DUF305 family) [Mucilaginibacter sp. AK015]MBS1526528.1 DUF305 domain-containing protein [Bacteroidota bacterium]NCD68863.1 DUF305 domain-containing protein [Mucilaginibacter agri]QQL50552.1 DUF305 domain-containing protein [Mucilaginibacter ginkgonis]
MKTSIVMIPLFALGATGMNAEMAMNGRLMSSHYYPTTDVSMLAQMQGDPLMEAMNKMMKEMHAQQMKGNIDLDFATMLRIHHMGAIDMAKVEVQQGKDAVMKSLAQKIVDAQTKEVTELDQLIPTLQSGNKNYDPANKNSGAGKAMSDNMMAMMKTGNMSMSSIDHEFADMMTKHHKDGLIMAKSILANAKNGKLRSMAQKSIPEQTSDISKMEHWMQSHK